MSSYFLYKCVERQKAAALCAFVPQTENVPESVRSRKWEKSKTEHRKKPVIVEITGFLCGGEAGI